MGRTWFARASRALRPLVVALAAGLAFGESAIAAGTPAGTAIPNTAVLTYSLAGVPQSVSAAAPPVIVAQVLRLTVTWQDASPVPSSSPDTARPLAFIVTNTGNGPDVIRLTRNNAVAGDQFDPADAAPTAVWLESGVQAGFQASGPAADLPYLPGVNDLALAADASRVVYLASSIPAGLATGALGSAMLTAASLAVPPGAAPGAQVGLAGSTPIVVGPGGARASATGAYLVSSVSVGIAKSVAAVRDTAGGTLVRTGSVITYRLLVTSAGAGTVTGVTVTDPLPAALTFVPGSITVDGAARTDAADADDSSFAAGVVRTVLPSITAPASRLIEFKATVN